MSKKGGEKNERKNQRLLDRESRSLGRDFVFSLCNSLYVDYDESLKLFGCTVLALFFALYSDYLVTAD